MTIELVEVGVICPACLDFKGISVAPATVDEIEHCVHVVQFVTQDGKRYGVIKRGDE